MGEIHMINGHGSNNYKPNEKIFIEYNELFSCTNKRTVLFKAVLTILP